MCSKSVSVQSGKKESIMNNNLFVFTTLFLFLLQGVMAQNTQVEFGKNRVQYHQDFAEWSKYESDNFITYWYGEGRNVGQAVVQFAEYDFFDIQNILEHRMNQKIQIIVYADLTDLKQSNIGNEEAFTNTGGQTKIVGNKVFVYFDGNHNSLRRQIREGIASVYLDAMLFGSNLQEIVQNAVMMNLPDWFKKGLVSFVGESWDSNADNILRDILLDEDFEGFDVLAEENPELAGRSLWYFISENFSNSTVSNLLYLTRINRSVESGFLYVLGNSYEEVTISWQNYFKQRYLGDIRDKEVFKGQKVTIKNKRNLPISEIKLSPDGTKLIYVTNEIGKYKVYLYDILNDERKLIHKGGFRNAFQATDYNYPLLAWNPSGLEIGLIYEKRDVVRFMKYDITNGKSVEEDMAPQYQRVFSMEYVNPNVLVLSAAIGGYSDIVLYISNTRQTQRITQDFYDDLDASVTTIGNKKGILFASNRQDTLLTRLRLDTILPKETFDIFYYDYENRSKELVRVTHTPLANERKPSSVDTTFFSYLSDRSGVYNRELAYLVDYIHHYEQVITLNDGEEIILHADSTLTGLDSTAIDTIIVQPVIKKKAIIHQNSNYQRGILEQNTAPRVNKIANLVLENGRNEVYIEPMDTSYMPGIAYSYYQLKRLKTHNDEIIKDKKVNKTKEKEQVIEDDIFQIIIESEVDTVPKNIKEPTRKIEKEAPVIEKSDSTKLDVDNYLFQSEFDEEEPVLNKEEPKESQEQVDVVNPQNTTPAPITIKAKSAEEEEKEEIYKFRPGRITPYRLEFRTDYVTTQLDNSLLFEGLESFAATDPSFNQRNLPTSDGGIAPPEFNYPPPGILLKANFKDLFEDYEFEGGVRIPTTFRGSEYFLVFDDKKKRLDKRFALYRKNDRIDLPSNTFVQNKREVNILLGQFSVRYPLDIFRSLRATGTLRRDRITRLATEVNSLEEETVTNERAGLKLEYVFDNTLDIALNIKNGTRYKIYVDLVKRFNLDIDDGIDLTFNEGFMTVVGIDARHYERVLKHSVFATRLAAATSFGSERMLYYLGGVDNWLFPSFNNDVLISGDNDFAFQTTTTNLRGFNVNIRNGNSFALINSELRVPIFKYFSKRIKSAFFRNFQMVGFFDVGTAWTGDDPYGPDNPLNNKVLPDNPGIDDLVSVRVNFFRDPIVAGYGVGARTTLFGYFIRLDYAWGIETRKVLDPILYIALGMDF